MVPQFPSHIDLPLAEPPFYKTSICLGKGAAISEQPESALILLPSHSSPSRTREPANRNLSSVSVRYTTRVTQSVTLSLSPFIKFFIVPQAVHGESNDAEH